MVDFALAVSLGLNIDADMPLQLPEALEPQCHWDGEACYIRLAAERDVYKDLYDRLLDSLLYWSRPS